VSLLFTDTFAGGDISTKYDANSGALAATDSNARTNGYLGYSNGSNARTLTKSVFAADEHATFIAGQAHRRSLASPGAFAAFAFLSDTRATTHVTIEVTPGSSGTVKAYRGTSGAGTLLGTYTGSVVPSASTWYYLEAKVTLHDSAGTIEVKIDGVTVLSLTGQDTKNAGTKTVFDSMSWKLGNSSSQMLISDVYLCNTAGSVNNNFLNAPQILWLKPNGNGNSSQGIGSDGNSTDNYALVDDGPGNIAGADYVDFVGTGDKDTYAFEDPSGTIPTTNAVKGAVVTAHAQKTDVGARTLIAVARASGSESDSASAPLTNGTYVPTRGVIETKPGGGAWTVGDLTSMEFGVKAGS
jgi:hypothetical protein